jgi:hypothetical protein
MKTLLVPPFNSLFDSVEHAHAILDVFAQSVRELGEVDDPRFAMNIQGGGTSDARFVLSFGSYKVLAWRIGKGRTFRVILAVNDRRAAGYEPDKMYTESSLGMFVVPEDAFLPSDSPLRRAHIDSLAVVRDRFENWKSSSVRKHEATLIELICHPDMRARILCG